MLLPPGVRVKVPDAPGEAADHPALGPAVDKVTLELRPVHHLDAAPTLESAPDVVTLDQADTPGGFQSRTRAVSRPLPDYFVLFFSSYIFFC